MVLDYFLQLNFKTPLNLLIFMLFLAVNSLWVYYRLNKKSRFSLAPFILVNLLFFLIWWRNVSITQDESEHLHCAWMVSQGLIPFRDFWQHHPPLIWLALAPFFKILKPSAFIFELSRGLALVLFSISGILAWQLAKKVWQTEAKLSVFMLMLFASAIYGNFARLRPDLFMHFFLLIGLYFSLSVPYGKKTPTFLAGACFALACSFMFKQYLLLLLVPIILFLEKGYKNKLSRLLFYFAGLIVGAFPLIFYLTKHKILGDFFFWVIQVNSQRVLVRAVFSLPFLLLSGWGSYLLFKRYRRSGDIKSLILLIAFSLVTLSSCTNILTTFASYYLGFWLFASVIVCSGCDLIEISKRIRPLISRAFITGLFFTLLIPSYSYNLQSYENGKFIFSEDKAVINKLIEYCKGNDTCFLFLPFHPIFNRDATRLYSQYQYFFMSIIKGARADAKKQNIVNQIIDRRPAVIAYHYEENQIILDLFLKELISKDDLVRLNAFLKANYTVKYIGRFNKYYIRNDKL